MPHPKSSKAVLGAGRSCTWLLVFSVIVLGACGDSAGGGNDGNDTGDPDAGGQADTGGDEPDVTPEPLVPEFGINETRAFTQIGDAVDGLATPRDLEFHPDRPNELWTVNRASDGTVIYFDPGTDQQRSENRIDAMGNHFMEEVSSLAFGANDTFGTCQESRNSYDHQAPVNDFMGPALWPADLEIYARVNQSPFSQLLGSHIDMLHQSPLCMGIAHDHDNVYWVFDGFNGHLVYYDFQVDHGPGYDDHADGIVRRYPEVALTYLADVPGHLALHSASGWLYIADPGAHRVIRFDTASGSVARSLPLNNEPLEEFSEMTGAVWEVFADQGLEEPSGIALGEERVFVSDRADGELIAYDYEGNEIERIPTGANGLMGLELGPDGKLWFVEAGSNRLWRLDPSGPGN